MFKRLIFVIAIIPTTLILALIMILSALWWVITGNNLLWMIDKITEWLNKLI